MQDISTKPCMNHIYRASVLLGRITILHNHLHLLPDHKEYQVEFANLRNIISLFCFAVSRYSGATWSATSEELYIHCWLSALIQTCNILLFHPVVSEPQQRDTAGFENTKTPGLPHCLIATQQILSDFRKAQAGSSNALTNPFLSSTYFLCCRFLTIRWCEDRNQADRENIDFLFMLLDRMGEKWAPLAGKYRKGMLRDLLKKPEEVRQMMVGTGHYLDAECA